MSVVKLHSFAGKTRVLGFVSEKSFFYNSPTTERTQNSCQTKRFPRPLDGWVKWSLVLEPVVSSSWLKRLETKPDQALLCQLRNVHPFSPIVHLARGKWETLGCGVQMLKHPATEIKPRKQKSNVRDLPTLTHARGRRAQGKRGATRGATPPHQQFEAPRFLSNFRGREIPR